MGGSSCLCRRRRQGELARGRGVGCCGGGRGSLRSAGYFLGSNDDQGGVRRGRRLETRSCFWRRETGLERREARGWRRTGVRARGSDVPVGCGAALMRRRDCVDAAARVRMGSGLRRGIGTKQLTLRAKGDVRNGRTKRLLCIYCGLITKIVKVFFCKRSL